MPAWDTRGRLWSKPINEKIFDFEGNSWGAGPRATPTVADGMIFTLAADGELAAVDVANFVETTGHYRIAMKGRSGTTIENSTVPPILSRTKPVLLAELARPKREAASRTKGQIVLDWQKVSGPSSSVWQPNANNVAASIDPREPKLWQDIKKTVATQSWRRGLVLWALADRPSRVQHPGRLPQSDAPGRRASPLPPSSL